MIIVTIVRLHIGLQIDIKLKKIKRRDIVIRHSNTISYRRHNHIVIHNKSMKLLRSHAVRLEERNECKMNVNSPCLT